MGWVDESFVLEWQELFMQRIVKMRAEFVSGPPKRGSQVRTADIADEQSISGEDCARLCGVVLQIEDQNRNRFDCMSRSFKNLQAQTGKFQDILVLHGDEGIFRFRTRT